MYRRNASWKIIVKHCINEPLTDSAIFWCILHNNAYLYILFPPSNVSISKYLDEKKCDIDEFLHKKNEHF